MWCRARPYALAATASLFVYGVPRGWNDTRDYENKLDFETKKRKATQAIERFMTQTGIPGLSVGVSIDGENIWQEGFGLADVETGGRCTENTVMRIASISKSITSIIAGRMIDEGKLDLDKNIQTYLPNFPNKQFDGEDVEITTRQLLSHTGGIRHYPTDATATKNQSFEDATDNTKKKEFLLNEEFKSVSDAMKIFENDALVARPGTKFRYRLLFFQTLLFSYTTHGFTVISAVLENVSGKTYPSLVKDLFYKLGMHNSSLDNNTKIVPHRSRYYRRNKKHHLENCPEVNNSVKWAGGGLQSNVGDLLKFANAVLFSHQSQTSSPSPILSRDTLESFWKGEIGVERSDNILAGLGWFRMQGPEVIGGIRHPSTFWYHTGAAVGASSIILISPQGKYTLTVDAEYHKEQKYIADKTEPVSGTCIAMLCNLQDASLLPIATEIKNIFCE